MQMHGMAWTAGIGGILLMVAGVAAEQEPGPDLEATLARVGARLERRYERAQHVVSTERVSVRWMTRDLRPSGFPQRLEFERRVEWAAAVPPELPTATVVRVLQAFNGRAVEPDDDDERPCFARSTRSEDDDPLSALLPARRDAFEFSLEGLERVDGRDVVRVRFVPRHAVSADATWDDDCLSFVLSDWARGDAWVDVEFGDVLRLDERLIHRFEFRAPEGGRRRRRPEQIVLEQFDRSIRYQRVTFADPPDTLMLPRSIETSWALRGANLVPRTYRHHQFSDHRRFVTGGRVIAASGPGSTETGSTETGSTETGSTETGGDPVDGGR